MRAAFRRIAADDDGIAWLDGTLGPANPGQTIGASEFSLPFFRRSGIVFSFPKNLDVWIDEIEPGGHALDRNRLARIVVRRAVVRERHGCNRQKTCAHGQ